MEELIKALAPLGVGGLMAGVMSYFFYKAFLNERENGKKEREQLTEVIKQNAVSGEKVSQAITILSKSIETAERDRATQFAGLIQEIRDSGKKRR